MPQEGILLRLREMQLALLKYKIKRVMEIKERKSKRMRHP